MSKASKRRREDALRQEQRPKRKRIGLALGSAAVIVVLTLLGWTLYSNHDSKRGQVVAGTTPAAGMSHAAFEPTVPNRGASPGKAPEGMTWIPGGEFSMGANDPPDMDDVGMRATTDGRFSISKRAIVTNSGISLHRCALLIMPHKANLRIPTWRARREKERSSR